MPVCNAAATLAPCLDSILAQSFADFELLVVDDASCDETRCSVSSRARSDARIRMLRPQERGLVACLNAGLAEARAPLVARMDGDDRMTGERLALQCAYLRRHADVDVVASRVRAFPPDEVHAGMREYLRWQNGCLDSDALRDEIFVECPITHPSVMYRRAAVLSAGGYRDGDFPEDYDLWLRLNLRGSRMAKIDRCLLEWRQHPGSATRRDPRYAREAFDRLRRTRGPARASAWWSRPSTWPPCWRSGAPGDEPAAVPAMCSRRVSCPRCGSTWTRARSAVVFRACR